MLWYQRRDKSFTKLDDCIEFYWEQDDAGESKFIVWALREDRTVSPIEEFESKEEMKRFVEWLFDTATCDYEVDSVQLRYEDFYYIFSGKLYEDLDHIYELKKRD